MTIDGAIKYCLEEADNKEQAMYDLIALGYSNSQEREDCQKCAEEHRQIAEWLRDYQRLLTGKSSEFELLKDGTLIIESDIDLMTVNRILLSQRDTAWGVLFYPDKDNARNSDLINNYDTISRQAAIDAIHEDADWLAAQGSDWQVERMERDKSILKSLPSAEPEQLEKCPIYGGVCLHPSDQCYACPRHAGAEPIIRCTNCRFFKRNIPCTGGHYNGCEMWLDDGNEIRVMTDDYCSKALPKEGEEDETD